MNIPDSYWLVLLLAANAILLAAAAIAVIRFRKQCHRLEHMQSNPTVAAIADKTAERERQQFVIHLRLERRMSELEKNLRNLVEEKRMSNPIVDRPMPIDNAIRMAKSGASLNELTRSCGLNIGEARLMQKLHSKRQLAVTT